MIIQVITSSYPADPDDPTGTAGLFVRQFALELANRGHKIVVQPAGRKSTYEPEPNLTIVPSPWLGGDQELASMSLFNPLNWLIFIHFIVSGIRTTMKINREHSIERTLCAWAVPSGIFGLAGKLLQNVPYDVWALGSDIWKTRKIPLLGKMILRTVMRNADRVYADGFQLCRDVEELTGVSCEFLPSSRKLPPPKEKLFLSGSSNLKHLLFVGRYHLNKGPDLLVKAIGDLPADIRETIRVHMFGFGPLEEMLREMITDMQLEKYIDLNPPIQAQRFSDYLDSVSLLVIPSRIESIPVVFSDALQLGTPIISMPVGDLETYITEYRCGIVATAVTPEALTTAMTSALSVDKESFREGIAKACKQFDLGNTVATWLGSSPAAR